MNVCYNLFKSSLGLKEIVSHGLLYTIEIDLHAIMSELVKKKPQLLSPSSGVFFSNTFNHIHLLVQKCFFQV